MNNDRSSQQLECKRISKPTHSIDIHEYMQTKCSRRRIYIWYCFLRDLVLYIFIYLYICIFIYIYMYICMYNTQQRFDRRPTSCIGIPLHWNSLRSRSIFYHILLNNHFTSSFPLSPTKTSMISSVSARPFSCKWKHECIRKNSKGAYVPNSVTISSMNCTSIFYSSYPIFTRCRRDLRWNSCDVVYVCVCE